MGALQGVAQYMSSFDTDANIFDDLLSAVSKPANLPTSEKFARLFISEIIHSWAGNSIIHRYAFTTHPVWIYSGSSGRVYTIMPCQWRSCVPLAETRCTGCSSSATWAAAPNHMLRKPFLPDTPCAHAGAPDFHWHHSCALLSLKPARPCRPSADAAADILRSASTQLPSPMAAHVLRAASCCTFPQEDSHSPHSPPRNPQCAPRAFGLPPRSSSSPQGLDRDIDSACEGAAAEEGPPSRRQHSAGARALSLPAPDMGAPVVVAVKTNWMDSVSQVPCAWRPTDGLRAHSHAECGCGRCLRAVVHSLIL